MIRNYPPCPIRERFLKESIKEYKSEYNVHYKVYKKFANRVTTVTNRFIELENKLKCSQQQEIAMDYQEIQREIIEKLHDPTFFSTRKKLSEYHETLCRIKKEIMYYEQLLSSYYQRIQQNQS